MIDHNELLYKKMEAEYDLFIEQLKNMKAGQIINCAYEKVFKEDMLLCVGEGELPQEKAKALYMSKAPLDECYRTWMEKDCGYMSELTAAIEETADKRISYMREKATVKDTESR